MSKKKYSFTDEEIEKLKYYYEKHEYDKAYSVRPEISKAYISKFMNKLGYKKKAGTKVGNLYFDKDIKIISELYKNGNWEEIFNLYPNTSKSAIHTLMNKHGFKAESFGWKDWEIKILTENYGKISNNEIAKLLEYKHGTSAISSKAKKIGLSARTLWSKEEDDILITNYELMSNKELTLLFDNRDEVSIKNRAKKLGLKKPSTLWTDEEKNWLRDNYLDYSDVEISEILNRTPNTINRMRCLLKLSRQDKTKSSYDDLSAYVRHNNLDWKERSIRNCNFKCVVTNKRFDDIHHVYGFNLILNETIEFLNIPIKENMIDYTQEELTTILKVFREKQDTYPLGVCLTKETHKEFHAIYGYGSNTIEQWNEFLKTKQEVA